VIYRSATTGRRPVRVHAAPAQPYYSKGVVHMNLAVPSDPWEGQPLR
jgi:hypothetical protein